GGLPILEGKAASGGAVIYVCQNKTCLQPVTEAAAALRQLASLHEGAAFKKKLSAARASGFQTNIYFKT
ncbi:MAG: hypothetical protein L0Y73_03930, partial [Candidatus Aminicenantes bacterium]|nr:hypothetical protein [Candidatus Aminicenantes bacterium]